jgi:hypothetical protein
MADTLNVPSIRVGITVVPVRSAESLRVLVVGRRSERAVRESVPMARPAPVRVVLARKSRRLSDGLTRRLEFIMAR